jgi:SAM-dependent methyltransferase
MDSTLRFSSRVKNYVRYRPKYPDSIITTLCDACQLTPDSVVVDVGSGTGFLSELFLRYGNPVIGVEPNVEMRQAGEYYLRHVSNFRSVDGRAEAIPLEDCCADFVVAGQAFHWFDRALAHQEFSRILAPSGWVALVWNDRETNSNAFLRAYEHLLQTYAVDYDHVKHRHVDTAMIRQFFGHSMVEVKTFLNGQDFDYEGLKGRLLSSSYTPEEGHPDHDRMLAALAAIFRRFSVDGHVQFEYTTRLYYGRLNA